MRHEDRDGRVKAGELCRGHIGLNAGLMWDVWNCVRREFDKGIGHTLYPVIMHGGLSSSDEWKIRQLEPVLRMWHPEYNLAGSAPLGRAPIDAGEKWMYQENGCPACLLSRIGSEEGVAFALLAGCVARYPSRHIGKRDRVRSRRVLLVRCWLEAFESGKGIVRAAWDLGEEIRRMRRNLRKHERAWRGVGFYGHLTSRQILRLVLGQGQDQTPLRLCILNKDSNTPNPPSPPHSTASSDIEIDISDPFDPKGPKSPTLVNATVNSTSSQSSKIGVDLSEPYNPVHLHLDVPTNPYSLHPPLSSIYSRTTLAYPTPVTSISPPISPTYTRSPGPSDSSLLMEHQQQYQDHTDLFSHRQPFSSSSIITIPSSMHILRPDSPDVQTSSVLSSMPELRRHGVSINSLAVRLESARTDWGSECGDRDEWEEMELVPEPLSPRSGSSKFTSTKETLKFGSGVGLGIEVGNTQVGTAADVYRYDVRFGGEVGEVDKPGGGAVYDVSPPESPIENLRSRKGIGSTGNDTFESTSIEHLYDGSAYGGPKTPDREWYGKQLVKLGG
jgi:hypothetical protein